MADKLAYITPIGTTGVRLEGDFNTTNTAVLPPISFSDNPQDVYPTGNGSQLQPGVVVASMPETDLQNPIWQMYVGGDTFKYFDGINPDPAVEDLTVIDNTKWTGTGNITNIGFNYYLFQGTFTSGAATNANPVCNISSDLTPTRVYPVAVNTAGTYSTAVARFNSNKLYISPVVDSGAVVSISFIYQIV